MNMHLGAWADWIPAILLLAVIGNYVTRAIDKIASILKGHLLPQELNIQGFSNNGNPPCLTYEHNVQALSNNGNPLLLNKIMVGPNKC